MSLVQKTLQGLTKTFMQENPDYFRSLIGKGNSDLLKSYLDKFPHAAQWKFGPNEYTAIHECVMARHYDLIPLFQSHGVDINAPDAGGAPPLRWTNNKEQIAQMVAMGATMDDPRWKGLTPLMHASMFAWTEQVEGLLKHGADPHRVFDGDWDLYKGKTALQIASRFTDDMGPDDVESTSQGRTVELLLSKGGHSVEELEKCRALAGNCMESRPAAKLLQTALEKAIVDQAADEKKAIENIVHGLPERTVVGRPIVLKKP